MKASYNQVSYLLESAKRWGQYGVLLELLGRDLSQMTQDRYRMIRNAILYNQPQRAIKFLKKFPVDHSEISVFPKGGEI